MKREVRRIVSILIVAIMLFGMFPVESIKILADNMAEGVTGSESSSLTTLEPDSSAVPEPSSAEPAPSMPAETLAPEPEPSAAPAKPAATESPEPTATPEPQPEPTATPPQYIFVFLDAASEILQQEEVAEGGTVGFIPEAPAQEGRQFVRWYQVHYDEGAAAYLGDVTLPYDFASPVLGDVYLMPAYEPLPPVYQLLFLGQNDEILAELAVEEGAAPLPEEIPAAPALEGYTFSHWYSVSPDAEGIYQGDAAAVYDLSAPIFENTALKAKYEEAVIAPSFEKASMQSSAGSSRFGDIGIMSIISPVEDTHTYKFFENASAAEPFQTQIVKDGEKVLEPKIPELANKKFLFWSADGTTAFDFTQPVTVTQTKTINLYPVYEDRVYVYFMHDDTDDNTANFDIIMTKETVNKKTDGSLVPVVTWPGKTFSHWSLEINGATAFDFNTEILENTVLYAVLQNQWLVSFDPQGGTYVESAAVNYNDPVNAPANPSRDGYTFSHWSRTQGGTAYNFSAGVTSDMTLYAVWTPNTNTPYKVAYWFENAENTEYSYVGYEAKTGTTGTPATYTQYTGVVNKTYLKADFTHFTYDANKTEQENIAGNGTTIVNVYYSRNTFTLKFQRDSWSLNIISPPGEVQVKHGASTKYWWDIANDTAYNYDKVWRDVYDNTINLLPPIMPIRDLTFHLPPTTYDYGTVYFAEYASASSITTTAPARIIASPAMTSASFVPGRQFTGFTWHRTWGRTTVGYDYWGSPIYGSGWAAEGNTYGRYPYYNPPFVGGDYGVISAFTRNMYGVQYMVNGGEAISPASRYYEYPLDGNPDTNPNFPHSSYAAAPSIIPTSYEFGKTTKTENNITYYFLGWYDNEAFAGEPFDPTGKTMPANHLVLYAKWGQKPLQVRFHSNPQPESAWVPSDTYPGGIDRGLEVPYQDPKPGQVPSGAEFTSADDPNDDFFGWYWYVNSALVKYNFAIAVDKDLDLYAVWGNPQLKVTYNLNGGSGTAPVDSNEYKYFTKAYLLPGTSVVPPENKVFLGWSLTADGSTGILSHSDYLIMDEGKTLYARYGDTDTLTGLTYNANGGAGGTGGSGSYSVSLANNATTTVLELAATNISRAGYQFIGWDTKADGSGSLYRPGDEIMVDRLNATSENILYAQWEELIPIRAQKSWFLPPGGLPGGDMLPDIWFTLYRKNADGTETKVDTKQVPTITAAPYIASVTWENQPETDTYGYTYVYTVKETKADGSDFTPPNYTKTESGLNVTNTYQSVSFTARKEWSANTPADRPEIQFQLSRRLEGETTSSPFMDPLVVPDSGTVTWNNLPQFNAAGLKYVYDADEVTVPASYVKTLSLDGAVRVITNTYQDTSYTVKKVWSDLKSEYTEANWPELTLQLHANGVALPDKSVTVLPQSKTNTEFTHTWTGLPKFNADGSEIRYTAFEQVVPSHFQMTSSQDAGNTTTTITNTYNSGTINASKLWDDPGLEASRPDSVTFQLWQVSDDSNVSPAVEIEYGDPRDVLKTDDWNISWENLPSTMNVNGVDVNCKYKVTETVPANYYLDAVSSASLTLTNVAQTTNFTATKNWVNGASPRPDVTLYLERRTEGSTNEADFAPVANSTVTLSHPATSHTWEGLDRFATWDANNAGNRVLWEYRVREQAVPINYVDSYPNNNTVTNTYVIPYNGTAEATKIWVGGPVADHTAPMLELWRAILGEGGVVEKVPDDEYTLTVTPATGTADSFNYKWENLKETDSQGRAYVFGFTENDPSIPETYTQEYSQHYTYETTYYGYSGSVLSNKYMSPKNTTVTANKVWENGPAESHVAPPLTLWRNTATDTTLKRVNATPTVVPDTASHDPINDTADSFTYTWTGLEDNDPNGEPYIYYFREDNPIESYKRMYDEAHAVEINGVTYGKSGGTVTNSFEVQKTASASATKQWMNGSADDHKEVSLTLWRKEAVGTFTEVTVDPAKLTVEPNAASHDPINNTADSFTYTWTELDKTDIDGFEYSYYFTEDTVPTNYTRSYSSTVSDAAGKEYAPSGQTVTNSYVSPKIKVTVTKEWVHPYDDPNNPYTAWPNNGEVTIQLYRGSSLYENKVTVNKVATWEVDKTDAAGVDYTYSAWEVVPDGYTGTGTPMVKDADGNFSRTITNTKLVPRLAISKTVDK